MAIQRQMARNCRTLDNRGGDLSHSGLIPAGERNILVVGHSHVHALRLAAAIRRQSDPERPRTRTIHLLDPTMAPEMDGDDFSPALKSAITDQIARHDPIITSAIGGNAHAAFSMIPHERIDFEIDGGEILPLDPKAKILSEADIRKALSDHLELEFSRLRLFRSLAGPFWHLESPPPVRSTEWILQHAEEYFSRQPEFRSLGIAPAGVRYRTWLLASRMAREECERLGCAYVAVPGHLRGEAGLLRPSQARDATHGNASFGEAMLRELERVAGGRTHP